MKHFTIITIITLIVCTFSACQTEYDEPDLNWTTSTFKTGELNITVQEIGYDHIIIHFGVTTTADIVYGDVTLNDTLAATFENKNWLTLTNLKRNTTYFLQARIYDGNIYSYDTLTFKTKLPFVETIARQNITYNSIEQQQILDMERLSDGDIIECVWDGGIRRIDTYGNVKWQNNVNARELNTNIYGKIAANDWDKAYIINPETGTTTAVCTPSYKDLLINDACVCKDGTVEVIGYTTYDDTADWSSRPYYGKFDAQGNIISEKLGFPKDCFPTGLSLRQDGTIAALGKLTDYKMESVLISQDGTVSKSDDDYYEIREEGSDGFKFSSSCSDAYGNSYFFGTEEIYWGFYYIYPILVKVDKDGKIAWTKRLRWHGSYSYPRSLYCADDKLFMSFTQDQDHGDPYSTFLVTDLNGNQLDGICFGDIGTLIFAQPEPNTSNYLIYINDGQIRRCIPTGFGDHPDFSI